MVKQSRHSYPETIRKLSAAIESAGNTIFATIDQSAAAASARLTLRPTSLIVFGNPTAGRALMEGFPLVGLELPLKLLVWDDEDTVRVAYAPMSEIAGRYGVTGMGERIAAIDRALDALTNAVT